MHIMHVALGGCLKPSPVSYGITQDTGGHIAYILGAAAAQAASDPATRVSIVTRAFDEPALGADHALITQPAGERLRILRLRTGDARYLSKSALAAELPALRRAFLALSERDPPAFVHAHFADAAELALAASRRHGMPVLYTPHSLALDKPCGSGAPVDGRDIAERLERETRAIVEADAIIVSSKDECRRQVTAYDPSAGERCVVVRPGIHLTPSTGTELASALIDPFLDRPGRPFLLAIARPVPKKNLPRLLEAYAGSDRLRRRADLVILAGQHERIRAERDEQGDQLDRLQRLVARHGLAGSVALPPAHAPETVTQLYRLAARRRGLFVNPARHEPFGLTLIEAARFGLPVVATRHGGPRDIVASLGHGRLVDPDDPGAIADACEALLANGDAYDAASRSARERHGLYSWDAWATTIDRVIARVRARRSATSSIRTVAFDTSSPGISPRADGETSGRHLLAFDIDDTLTGCTEGAARFRRWIAGRDAEALPFAVATGRELPEALAVIEQWRLPRPDVWLTSVGSEIWRPRDGGLQRCEAWAAHLSAGWDREAIVARLGRVAVRLQAPKTQRPWKVSLFGTSGDAAVIGSLFDDPAFDVRVVASHGRFIDILPRRAGKAAATRFEAARRGIPMARCVSAGNSGNDVDMLRLCGKAILVANALPEIDGLDDRVGLHRASTPYAHGVLEGLAAFDLIGRVRAPVLRGGTPA